MIFVLSSLFRVIIARESPIQSVIIFYTPTSATGNLLQDSFNSPLPDLDMWPTTLSDLISEWPSQCRSINPFYAWNCIIRGMGENEEAGKTLSDNYPLFATCFTFWTTTKFKIKNSKRCRNTSSVRTCCTINTDVSRWTSADVADLFQDLARLSWRTRLGYGADVLSNIHQKDRAVVWRDCNVCWNTECITG